MAPAAAPPTVVGTNREKETTAVSDSEQSEKEAGEASIPGGRSEKVSLSSGGDDDGEGDNDDNKLHTTDPGLDDATEPTQVEDSTPTKLRKKKSEAQLTESEEKEGETQEEDVAVSAKKNQQDQEVKGDKEDDDKEMAPIQAPNGLYRFLLGKGTIGHILVLALVLLVEWVQIYIPQLAELLAALWTKLAPTGLQRRMAPQQYSKGGDGASSAHLQQLYSARLLGKGKEGKKLKERIDQEAVDLLKSIGDVQDAKYRHVSVSFLQRHGLGPYSDGTVDDEESGKSSSSKSQKKSRAPKKKKNLYDENDEDEASDVDWVLEGLSGEKAFDDEETSPIDTSLSFGIGPKGPVAEVGVEFSLGGSGAKQKSSRKKKKTFNAESIARDTVRKKKSGPRLSDRDGGSGWAGRIRAAATSNSLMSRSLLGAYPGDAAAVTESADSRGVTDLARKYGYGDWSEDDDSDDGSQNQMRSRRKSRKSKSKQKKESRKALSDNEGDVDIGLRDILNNSDEDVFDFGSLISDAEDDTEPLLPAPKRRSTSKPAKTRKKTVRPALERLSETEKKTRSKTKKKSTKRSNLDRLAKESNKDQKMVRPALERLNELKKKGNDDSAK